jgi:hypothetical protein
MSHRWLGFAVILGVFVLGSAFAAQAQRSPGRGDVGWVGLYNTALIEWLENENRLSNLCSDTLTWRECREEKMMPKQYLIDLRDDPREAAASEGTLVIRATPGQRLRAYYRSAHGGREREFVPDLFDADWGYGPYFHQTFLERRGTWFLLPAGPLSRPGWVNMGEPHVRLLRELHETRDVIMTPNGDLVVIGMDRRVLRARPAQKADQWCEAGNPPPLEPWSEIRIPVQKLYNAAGHLLVDIKYKRGC